MLLTTKVYFNINFNFNITACSALCSTFWQFNPLRRKYKHLNDIIYRLVSHSFIFTRFFSHIFVPEMFFFFQVRLLKANVTIRTEENNKFK